MPRNFIVVAFTVSLVVLALLTTSCGDSMNRVKGVRVEVDSDSNVIVYWDGVPIERDLIAYHVYWSRDPEFPEDNRNMGNVSRNVHSYTIRKFEPGKWYIRARALFLRTYDSIGSSNQAEVEGPWSETATVIILSTSTSKIDSRAAQEHAPAMSNQDETPTSPNGDFVQHRDVANQYSILYPSDWEPMPDNVVNLAKQQLPESRQLLLAVWSKDGKLNMQVSKERTDENGSLNDLYESSLASSPLPHNTVSKDEVTIDGIKAIKAVRTTTTPNGRPAKYLHLFLLRDGYVWTIGIGGAPGSFDTYLTNINKMVDSFSFEKP